MQMHRTAVALALLLGALASPLAAQRAQQQSGPPAGAAADAAVAANAQMSGDPFMAKGHIAYTPARPMTRADSLRAAETIAALRTSLEKYRDVEAAKRDGFQIFAPEVPGQRVYHFNNYAYAMASEANFDPTKPTSLLYSRSKDGRFKLEGAMYTAPADLPLEQLDSRVPLSVGRWHRHVNFCLPPRGGRARWNETRNGKRVFGPRGVATQEECDAVGGRFVPQVFGWMLHVMPFVSDDPRVVFGGGGHGGGHAH